MVKRWVERWRRWRERLGHLERPYKLVLAALLPLIAVAILEYLFAAQRLNWLRDGISQSAFYGPLFFPADAEIAWKDRLQGIVLLLGLPVAFCLWHWRDRNVRDQIEEQRKQVIEQQRQVGNQNRAFNLTEFQEVQMRAAGALDEKLPAEAREQLQIAALHQLRGFLRGEYGESFRRPAFELLLAGHAEAMERIGLPGVLAQIRAIPVDILVEFSGALTMISAKLDRVMKERMNIISDEWRAIFLSGFPLKSRSFDFLSLGHIDVGRHVLDLSHSSFVGARLDGALSV